MSPSAGSFDHLTTDRFLSPAEFDRHHDAAFPGARYTDMYRCRMVCWDAPA